MSKSVPLTITVAFAALLAQPALAQTPSESLAANWDAICVTAIDGTLLFVRCDETINSTDPDPNMIAATGQRLEEIPGQGRVATRDVSLAQSSVNLDVAGHKLGLSMRSGNDGMMSFNATSEGGLAAPWSLFFSADLGRINRKSSPNEAAFDARTGSMTVGIDWQVGPNWQFGTAINHVREDLDYSASASQANTRFTGAFLTTSRSLGNTWSANGYYGYFRGGYQLSRDISYTLSEPSGTINVVAEADASPDARRRVSGLALNGQWALKGWDFGLVAGQDKSDTTIEPYTETGGGGLALVVPGRTISTRRGRLDLTLGKTFSTAHGVFQPLLQLGWRQEFGNPRRALTVRLTEDPLHNRISFDTEDPDTSWGEVALGGVMTFTGGHSGFFQLRERFAHSFLQERLLAIGWRIEM